MTNLLDLLQGRLSKEILADITAKGDGLFPAPTEIKLGCSCPDSAEMCKHLAAVTNVLRVVVPGWTLSPNCSSPFAEYGHAGPHHRRERQCHRAGRVGH